jgi:hypothetical protein
MLCRVIFPVYSESYVNKATLYEENIKLLMLNMVLHLLTTNIKWLNIVWYFLDPKHLTFDVINHYLKIFYF